MSEEKCPRCGHEVYSEKLQRIAQSTTDSPAPINGTFYACGSYDILLTGFRGSELCETRQELATLKRSNRDDQASDPKG